MGFNVDNDSKLVTVDHSHNNYAITTIDGNPITSNYDGLTVTSVFRRTKNRRGKSDLGDNSPMLYAFKGMHGLTTQYSSVASLTKHFYKILDNFFTEENASWDIVIPMPSSHDIANILGRRVVRMGVAGKFEPSALKKITAQDAQMQTRDLRIASKDRTRINDYIKKFAKFNSWDTDFQMKSITVPKLRKYINPVTFGNLTSQMLPSKILLVDDMVTSGTTLGYAKQAIQERYPMAKIEALTLLSSSK